MDDVDRNIPALDGIRGWAILMVLYVHSFGVSVPSLSSLDKAMHETSLYGRLGVDLFFVLSGFLITGILLKSKNTDRFFINFFSRRILRIFPLYYLAITGIFFITPQLVDYFNSQLAPNIHLIYYSYLQNFLIVPDGTLNQYLLAPMWSLAVEEHFYLVWPIMVFYCKPQSVARIAIILVIIALVLRTSLFFYARGWRYWAASWTFCRMDAILIGALLAVFIRSGIREFLNIWKYYFAFLASAINIFVIYLNYRWAENGSWFASLSFGYTLHAIFFVSIINLILFLPKRNILVRFFDNGALRLFGKHSYCIYIVHMVINAILWEQLFKNISSSYLIISFSFFLASIIVSLLTSIVIWHAYEKHFLLAKRFFENKPVDTDSRVVPRSVADNIS
ncbi:acyltransferase family protein [Geotalea daltonii]|nr:acyltransferase [Geotalea daltonii]